MFGLSEHSVVELANNLKHGKKGADACKESAALPIWCMIRTIWSMMRSNVPRTRMSAPAKRTTPVRSKSSTTNRMPCAAKAILNGTASASLCRTRPQSRWTTEEMDHVYALPYMRTYHPSYEVLGGVPAIQEVQFSIIHNRGCFGACNFCALAFHQGRYIQVRSHESVIEGSEKDHPNARIQGIHPRCRRPDREFPLSGLQKTGEIRLLQGQALPVPHHLPEHRSRPYRLP